MTPAAGHLPEVPRPPQAPWVHEVRPGIDPEVALRLMLAGFLVRIVHDRRLMREAQVADLLPDHSSLTRVHLPYTGHPDVAVRIPSEADSERSGAELTAAYRGSARCREALPCSWARAVAPLSRRWRALRPRTPAGAASTALRRGRRELDGVGAGREEARGPPPRA